MQRFVTAVVAIGVVLSILWRAPFWGVWGLTAILASIGWWEILRLSPSRLPHRWYWGGIVLIGGVWIWLRHPEDFVWWRWAVVVWGLWLIQMLGWWRWDSGDTRDVVLRLSWITFGWHYVVLGFLIVWYIWAEGWRRVEPRWWYHPLIGLLLMIWVSDSLAYYIGRWQGRVRLAPAVSPNKTVEGWMAGLAGAASMAWVWGQWWSRAGPTSQWWHWLILGAIVGTIGPVGDLLESSLKRRAGVKDSGNVFPGHGGVLDRFDSLLISVPFYYLYWKWWIA